MNDRLIRRRILSLVLLLILALAFTGACDAHIPQSKETIVWRKLGAWSGRGTLQTESFLSETGGMRVTWVTRNETRPGAGSFRLSIHSAISGRTLGVAADHRGAPRALSSAPSSGAPLNARFQ